MGVKKFEEFGEVYEWLKLPKKGKEDDDIVTRIISNIQHERKLVKVDTNRDDIDETELSIEINGIKISVTESDDDRSYSYHVSCDGVGLDASDKLKKQLFELLESHVASSEKEATVEPKQKIRKSLGL